MSSRVFKKRYPKNSVGLPNGRFIRFEDVGNDQGFYVTEDSNVIAEFESCMKRGVGGIENSSMEDYQNAIKKKTTLSNSRANSSLLREIQTAGLVNIPEVPVAVALPVAVDTKPEAPKLDLPPIGAPEPKVSKKPTKQ